MLALERLHPRRAVDVRDRREPCPPLGPHREDAGHETREARAAGRQLEVAIGRFDGHDRRERPELLAILDFAIEPIAHFGRVRRGEDAAVAERTRPELESAVHPADDAAGGEIVGDPIDQIRVVQFSKDWRSSRASCASADPSTAGPQNGWSGTSRSGLSK